MEENRPDTSSAPVEVKPKRWWQYRMRILLIIAFFVVLALTAGGYFAFRQYLANQDEDVPTSLYTFAIPDELDAETKVVAYVGMANQYMSLGQWDKALRELQRGEKLPYNNSTYILFDQFGMVYTNLGNKDLAKEYYEKSLQALEKLPKDAPHYEIRDSARKEIQNKINIL